MTKADEVHQWEEKLAELRAREPIVAFAGARSVNKALGTLFTFLKFCENSEYIGSNAARLVKKLEVSKAGACRWMMRC